MKHHAQIFKALSDPIRLRIVLLLQSEGELCVCDLMAVLKLPQSTVSRHLAYLKRSCWVDTRRDGVWMHPDLLPTAADLDRVEATGADGGVDAEDDACPGRGKQGE